jgi:short-subunit dehydrogenase
VLLALVARRQYRLEVLARDIQEAGGTALVVDADIAADLAVRRTVEHLGGWTPSLTTRA